MPESTPERLHALADEWEQMARAYTRPSTDARRLRQCAAGAVRATLQETLASPTATPGVPG